MGFYEADDVDAMLEDHPASVDVTVSGVTVKGIRREVDQAMLQATGSSSHGTHRAVTVRTGALPTVTRGTAITVDGEAGVISAADKAGSGVLTHILYREAAS